MWSPRLLRQLIALVIAIVLIVALVMVLTGTDSTGVDGQDDYPDGARVAVNVLAVDANDRALKRQPKVFSVTLARVGTKGSASGARPGAGRIVFFGQQPGEYVLRAVSPKGPSVRFAVAENAEVTKTLRICLGPGC